MLLMGVAIIKKHIMNYCLGKAVLAVHLPFNPLYITNKAKHFGLIVGCHINGKTRLAYNVALIIAIQNNLYSC